MTRYPIGQQDFKDIREGGFAYVDKTGFIPKLLDGSKFYFLARPRRFGKSLFLSTLEYFFHGEKNLFKGLDVEKYQWDWDSYPVIHIDLGGANYDKKEFLVDILDRILSGYENTYQIIPENKNNPSDRFARLIRTAFEKTKHQVVVLIDEYEKPVIDTLGNDEVNDFNRDTLRGFYSVLKSSDKFMKLAFLTGVTKFGQMSVFSGLNNIRDISFRIPYGDICGITAKELECNFEEGIRQLAENEQTDLIGAIRLLKDNYDGYHFNENCEDIYNPYSLINALADSAIDPYWAASGTPKFLAEKLLNDNYNLEELEGIKVGRDRLMNVSNQNDDIIVLLFQTGYLTIKDYDKELREFTLGYPNREVEKAFFDYLLPNYSFLPKNEFESEVDNFKRYLNQGNPYSAFSALRILSAGISYDLIPQAETERHFQMILHMLIKLISSRNILIYPEYKTSDGRIDILIETPKFVYIIEIKKDKDAQDAIDQIKNKEYGLSFKNKNKKIFLIGMSFSTKTKRIENYIIESDN